MRICPLLILAFLLGMPQLARCEYWTNQAGRVIEGQLEKFDGAWLTLLRTNGTALRLPLSALCKPDQQRVLVQNALSIAPGFVIAAYKDATSVLERYNRLPLDQQTPEARRASTHMACAVFDGRISPRKAELADKAVQVEVKRLRALLASKTPS
jgi:hypothetical protein